MAKKLPAKGQFTPKNPKKYVGKTPIQWRSSWELTMMMGFDSSPSVIQWESESRSISYRNPLTGKWTFYIPDFVVHYIDKKGKQHIEMLEVKPLKEVPGYTTGRMTAQTKAIQMINYVKWAAAMQYCAKYKIQFKVLTEGQIFNMWKK